MAINNEVILIGIGMLLSYLMLYSGKGKIGKSLASIIIFVGGLLALTITGINAGVATFIALAGLVMMIYTFMFTTP